MDCFLSFTATATAPTATTGQRGVNCHFHLFHAFFCLFHAMDKGGQQLIGSLQFTEYIIRFGSTLLFSILWYVRSRDHCGFDFTALGG